MNCYLAKFSLPNGKISYREIWASTKAEAAAIASDADMGPITGTAKARKEFRPSILATLRGNWFRPDVLHSLCYIGFLAARHRLVSAEDLVGDDGPLHELAHYLSGPNMRGSKMHAHLESRVRWLEELVPGMPSKSIILKLPEN